jgi:hypothetical protein
VLLTLDNLANRSQYINAKNTFEELLRWATPQQADAWLPPRDGPLPCLALAPALVLLLMNRRLLP